jgi:hypothetical protein
MQACSFIASVVWLLQCSLADIPTLATKTSPRTCAGRAVQLGTRSLCLRGGSAFEWADTDILERPGAEGPPLFGDLPIKPVQRGDDQEEHYEPEEPEPPLFGPMDLDEMLREAVK